MVSYLSLTLKLRGRLHSYWGLNIWRSDYLDYKPIDLDAPTVLLNRTRWGVSTYGGFNSRVKPEQDWLQGDGVLM
eukprot:COSAG04_NODE_20696_length_388_cov_0.826990_2_plen_74_part_01